MLVTPSGLPYEEMTPEDIVFVGADGTVADDHWAGERGVVVRNGFVGGY